MNRTHRLALALVAVLVMPSLAAAAPARVAKLGAELRKETGFNGAVVAKPAPGTMVEVVEEQGAWRRVRLPDGAEGFMHELFLEAAPPSEPQPAPAPAAARADAASPGAAGSPSDEERGRLRAEIAALRTENGVLKLRAEAAEGALAAAQRERDAATAKANVLERRAQQQKEADTVPEELLQQARDEAVAEADRRCAMDLARGIDEAVTQAVAQATSAEAEKERTDRAVESDRAIQKVLHDAALKAAKDDCERHVAAARAAGSSEDSGKAAALEAELAAEKSARAADVAKLEADHQKLFDTYVEIVTTRHEEALRRDREACDAECQRLIYEERQRADRALRSARKESGWEDDFEKELKLRVDMALSEAEARWEAKRRGDVYDEQRVRKDEEARVRKACEGERLIAVQQALSSQAADHAAQLSREREEADLRCRLALEVVLEKAASGEDMTQLREFAKERTRRPDRKPPEPAPPAAEGTP